MNKFHWHKKTQIRSVLIFYFSFIASHFNSFFNRLLCLIRTFLHLFGFTNCLIYLQCLWCIHQGFPQKDSHMHIQPKKSEQILAGLREISTPEWNAIVKIESHGPLLFSLTKTNIPPAPPLLTHSRSIHTKGMLPTYATYQSYLLSLLL